MLWLHPIKLPSSVFGGTRIFSLEGAKLKKIKNKKSWGEKVNF
jgi:hypothetical protein